MSPYRPAPSAEPPCKHTQKCCGMCSCIVGGCLQGVEFRIKKIFGCTEIVRAGWSWERPRGTGRLEWCETHQRWETPLDSTH